MQDNNDIIQFSDKIPFEYKIILGKKIKKLRELLGYSQEKLAELLDYNEKSYICNIETGKKGMSMQKILEAAKLFDVPPQALLSEKDLSKEELEMMRNLWRLFDDPNNQYKESIKTLLQKAVE
jgi:transcriptional regulator with XRE-family HTH domain